MDLTDEQYSQLIRYADGGMEEKEKAFFEALLKNDETLAAGWEAYLEIQSLCASAGKKIESHIQSETGKKNVDAGVQAMVEKARAAWEAEHKEAAATDRQRPAKIVSGRKAYLWAAAIVTGIICASAAGWLLQKKSVTVQPEAAVSKGVPDSARQTSDGVVVQKPAVVQPGDSKASINKEASDPAQTEKEGLVHRKPPTSVDLAKLFTAYFKPDAPPDDAGKLLTEPVAFYRENKFDDATEAFEMAKAALDLRSSSAPDGPTRFYVYYYLAQTRLASGKQAGQSIGELTQAVKEARTEAFRRKAQWYLALAYLKKGDAAETKKQLAQLTGTDNGFRQQATALAQQLNGN